MSKDGLKITLLRVCSNDVKKNFHVRNSRPPLQLGYIASSLEEMNISYDFLDMFVNDISEDEIIDMIKLKESDYVIISCESIDRKLCKTIAKKVKDSSPQTMFIAVGQHASAAPEDLINLESPIDFCILGEYEVDAIRLIKAIEAGETIKKISSVVSMHKRLARPATVDFKRLPMPNHEMFGSSYSTSYPVSVSKRLRWGYILSSRGCPHNCVFCSNTIRESHGKIMRYNDPIKVVDEIEVLLKLGKNIISFRDDDLCVSREHIEGICNEMIRRVIDARWIAQCRIDEVDERLLNLMKDAGCVNLRFGVESASADVLKVLEKSMSPTKWVNTAKKTFATCKKVGIDATAFFILGNPNETLEDVESDIELVKEIQPDLLQLAYFTPYPGSPYYEKLTKKQKKKAFVSYHYSMPILNLSSMSDDVLKEAYSKFYSSFYLGPKNVARHYQKYGVYYMMNPGVWKDLSSMMLKLVLKK